MAHRRRRRDADPAPPARRRDLPARGCDHRGGGVPGRAALHPPRRHPDAEDPPVRALVVAEFYPRANDPVLGIWAHRQALATREAGADVRVAVLYRPIPPRADPGAIGRYLRQPPRATLDGIAVEYVPFVSPPRAGSYGRWGA